MAFAGWRLIITAFVSILGYLVKRRRRVGAVRSNHPIPKREIRQLWFAAEEYFCIAKQMFKDSRLNTYLPLTMHETSKWFDSGIPKVAEQREITLLVAHLSSASIRLCTIDECFFDEKDKIIPGNYTRLPSFKAGKLTKADIKGNGYIHQILRDNIGHRERAGPYVPRQDCIDALTVQEIFEYLNEIMKKFGNALRSKSII